MGNGLKIPYQIALRPLAIAVLLMLSGTMFLLYILFQARFLIQGPIIILTNEPATEQVEQIVYLEGSVKNITFISLNGRQIFTDETGYFKEALLLENGYTIATIAATDRYGRESRVVRQFVYTPAFHRDSGEEIVVSLLYPVTNTYHDNEKEKSNRNN